MRHESCSFLGSNSRHFVRSVRLDLRQPGHLRHKFGINDHPVLESRVLGEMRAGLNKVWWSRLVTATRGYVINAFKVRLLLLPPLLNPFFLQHSDEILFLFDDTFILIHSALVEGTGGAAAQLIADLAVLEAHGCEALQALEQSEAVDDAYNPFLHPNTAAPYE